MRSVIAPPTLPMRCLFLDIGGVLLTDGWPEPARVKAAATFGLDGAELERRHQSAFATYELDKSTLDEYLQRVVFHAPRAFTPAAFKEFMFAQSQPFPEMLALVRQLKAAYGLKIVVVSNEARELNAYRIRTFQLNDFVDAFVSSCYVKLRKPDTDIFHMALDIAQVPREQILYIENTAMFIDIAAGLGIRGILHTDYASTCRQLAALGLDPARRA